MLTLYDDVFSPYARKVRIALYEKGVPFERVRALHGDCNRTDFLHVNPRAEVPAPVDGDFSLYDSTVICEYLEDRYPEPSLYPADARLRAKCRLVEDLAELSSTRPCTPSRYRCGPPFASHLLAGRVQERPRARLRGSKPSNVRL